MIINTTSYLESRFNYVRSKFSLIILNETNRVTPDITLQKIANDLQRISERVFEESETKVGAMYKAGILTGTTSALHLLKTKFLIEPKINKHHGQSNNQTA